MAKEKRDASRNAGCRGTLVLYASLEQGKQLVGSVPPLPSEPDQKAEELYFAPRRAALACWKQALHFQNANSALADEITTRIEALAVGAGNEVIVASQPFISLENWARASALISSGIGLLRVAREIVQRERISLTLAVLYTERALSHLAAAKKLVGERQFERLSAAIQDYEEAMKLQPTDAKIKTSAANAYNSRACDKQNRNSIVDFTRAISLDPTCALYYANRAVTHLDAKNADKAIEDLKEACQRERKPEWVKLTAVAFNVKGMEIWDRHNSQYVQMPKWVACQAADCFKAAWDLDPTNSTFQRNYETARRACRGY